MHRLVSPLMLLAVAIASAGQPIAAGEAVDLPTLTAAIRSQLSAIATVEVKYQTIFDTRDGSQRIDENEWAEQGECLAFTRLPRQPVGNPESLFFDGAKGYQYLWDPSGERAARLTISEMIGPGYWKRLTPAAFIGRRIGESDISLVDLMRLPQAVLVGSETFQGRRCWRVVINSFEGAGKQLMQVSALFGEEQDYLPSQITLRYADDRQAHPNEPHRKNYFKTWTTNEFMRVNDSAGGGQRWFPKSAEVDTLFGLKFRLEVSSVVLNKTLPIDRFRPNSPDGTFIYDSKNGPLYQIQGGAAEADLLARRAARDALSELRNRDGGSDITINARPRRIAWAAYIVFACSVLTCTIASFLWFRSKK